MDIGHHRSRLGATIGFRFLQSSVAWRCEPRRARHAVGHSRLRHNALPARRPVDGRRFRPHSIEGRHDGFWLCTRRNRSSRDRPIAAGFARGTPRLTSTSWNAWKGLALAHKDARSARPDCSRRSGVREIEGDGAHRVMAKHQVSVRLRGRPGDRRLRLCRGHDLVFRPRSAGLPAARQLPAADHDARPCRRRPAAGRICDRAPRFRADRGRSRSG